MAETYDPADVTITFGDNILSGYGDGTFIVAAREDNEIFKSHTGAAGDQSWTKNNNRYGTITLTLKSTSPTRVFLDRHKELGTIFPLFVLNSSNQKHLAGGPEALIVTDPDVSYGDEEEMIEYVFGVRNLTMASIG